LARKLVQEGWRGKEIANTLHYANESHLCREFKRAYGLPPRKFRGEAARVMAADCRDVMSRFCNFLALRVGADDVKLKAYHK